ncbi:hypothetical protein KPL78_03905 [Roseomonas sp. HJA6]|uniref:Uncharacterized protein n=1 Tax=Roseomonas alba TaxID=2846776 RepID=A0ABS7A3V4_9PROT|nr:hypothetical protein [Neoroseomonas alba]MBW6396976.1 hypothetical protein [Neoroseomonas alba]
MLDLDALTDLEGFIAHLRRDGGVPPKPVPDTAGLASLVDVLHQVDVMFEAAPHEPGRACGKKA